MMIENGQWPFAHSGRYRGRRASKAFDMVMAEALWSELHGQGVDVLSLVLGSHRHARSPAIRRGDQVTIA